jgi:hypothetical protein
MIKKALISTVLICLSISIQAQFRMNNLVEYQLGNIPGEDPPGQSSLYDKLNLTYKYKNISVFSRVEQYYPTLEKDKQYTKLSQYKAQFATKKLTIEVGNIYTTLGRGLLLRNYEIPGSIYEARGYRVRYGFYKDLHGFSARYNTKHVGIKLIRGKVLTAELPPIIDIQERRADLIEGGEFNFRFKKQTAGLILMRHNLASLMNLYNSVFYNGKVKNFNIYAELAQRIDSVENVFNFSTKESFGAYLGISYTGSKIGFTLELKDYQNFIIGRGINDPPTLVKEHSSKLLNRSIHVPLINDEDGYQVEAWYMFPNLNTLTLNHSYARNYIADKKYQFKEFYLEYQFSVAGMHQMKAFLDYSEDPLKREVNRYSAGVLFDYYHKKFTSTFSAESQYIISESGNENTDFFNYLVSYTLSKSGKFSITALLETTKDPSFLDEGKQIDIFPSLSFSYDIDKHNKLSVFAGKRRGGPACSSGVCNDVLDFKGLEMRLTTRF